MRNNKFRGREVRTNSDSKARKKMRERFDRWRVYTGKKVESGSIQGPNWEQIMDES